MILVFEGTFDETSITTDIMSLGISNVTDVSYNDPILNVTYDGQPTALDMQRIKHAIENHDPLPDATQVLKNLTRQAMVDLAVSAETTSQIGWIIKDFNDELETIRANYTDDTAQELLDDGYLAWRILYDNLATPIQADIFIFTSFFNDPSDHTFTEPDPITNEYKVWFNRTIRSFLDYLIDRLELAR